MMQIKPTRVFICVKTIPVLSTSRGEVVCTAGIDEDGKFVRLYPIPFRALDREDQFAKFQWITTTAQPRSRDTRPESLHIDHCNEIKAGEQIKPEKWQQRKQILLKQEKIYESMTDLIALSHANKKTLAFYKPKKIKDLIFVPFEKNLKKLEQIKEKIHVSLT